MTEDARGDEHVALQIVMDIIARELAIPPEKVGPDTDLTKDVYIDSDDLSFLYIPAVHKRFGVVLSKEKWGEIVTLKQTVEAVLQARARAGLTEPLLSPP